ncbi:MAG TPA: hypothetical protein VHL54_03555 [Actinomycetota bacterium]|jgi:hypothetical protein|nr:hypothetical protein [Actinomycetota bacterium]
MRSHLKNKKKSSIIAIFLVMAVAGAAYAYFTAGGTGTGSATTAETEPLEAIQTSVVTEMGPGIAAQTLTGDIDNPNAEVVHVTSVTASIASVVKAVDAPVGDCTAADFTLANATMTVGSEMDPGLNTNVWTGATLAFNNTASNQDGCQGATVNLAYSIT